MKILVILILNSLRGIQAPKDVNEFCICKTERWMKTEFDENVSDYCKLPNGKFIVKSKQTNGFENTNDVKKNVPPSHLGAFILTIRKWFMNKCFPELNGFSNNKVFYSDTDSLQLEKKDWDVLDKAGLFGDNLCWGGNNYKSGGVFYASFLAPTTEYCLTTDENGIIQQHKTFERFNASERYLKRKQSFEMRNGNKISSVYPLNWIKLFSMGTAVPNKTKYW